MATIAPTNSTYSSNGDSTRFLISNLCDLLESYLQPKEIQDVYQAYLFGAEVHEGQTRVSGEPYIYHPLSVAKSMAEMHMDAPSIIAAILHDVIEDTPTAKEHLVERFGEEVAQLVDGVSKLTHLNFESKAEAQAENFRKMMLAMVKDIRVILIKLADRLHNMRTLSVMPLDKQRRIARETLDIYAPIAQRLGLNTIRTELETLGFQTLYPARNRVLEKEIKKVRGNRKELLQKIETSICERLEGARIESRIYGREKNIYSIYKKMRTKRLSFSDVYDVFAFRLIVDNADTCYRTLGVVHNLYIPVPGKFKDYIAIPKLNGYQSLHTVLLGPHGIPIEVQIRSQEMEDVAQSGIAAHWAYKSTDQQHTTRAHARAREWLKDILELQRSAGDSREFLESIKVDLFPDEVYVFTPSGEIMKLPRGATAVDFAYAVHSDIGNTCVAVKIDRRLAPLSTPLDNGSTIEVITAASGKPNPLWLNFVVTAKARTNIRHYLKNLREGEAIKLGRRLLDKALAIHDKTLDEISNRDINALLKELNLDSLDALMVDIGLGNRMSQLVARRLHEPEKLNFFRKKFMRREGSAPLAIRGTEGMVVSFGKCCHPIPGDPVAGVMSTGRGLVIHRENCRNVASYRDKPDKWVEVQWSDDVTGSYPVTIRLQSANERGMLATVASAISEQGSNIDNVAFDQRDGKTTIITFILDVDSRDHLAQIMRTVRKIPQVYKVVRIRG